ncbi:MAG: TRAP transporter substrate-binding protein [Sphingomonadales bacterium]
MSKNDNNKDRRQFLKAVGVVGATALVSACGQGKEGQSTSKAQSKVTKETKILKMVTTWPKNYPGIGVSAERFSERVLKATEGSVNIKVYAAGELVPALGAFDAVSQGKADCYHGPDYFWQGKSKAFNFFCSVPFGMTFNEFISWIYHDDGQKLWDELASGFNIKPILASTTGVQMGGWFRNEVKSLEDFQGLRMRMPGLGGEIITRMGGTTVTLAGGDIFLSLSQGNIDATEWVGPWNDLAFGFQDIAKYYYYPGIHEPGTVATCGFNLSVWNQFTDFEKNAIETCGMAETSYTLAEYNANNGQALDVLINKHGVQLKKFPDDVLEAMAKYAKEVIAETAAGDDLTGRIYDSYKSSLDRTSRWNKIGVGAYRDSRDFLSK